MYRLGNIVLLALSVVCYAITGVATSKVEFIGRSNEYFDSGSTNFETQSEIGCCTKCAFEDSCLATNYNHGTPECEILTQYPNLTAGNVASIQGWTLFIKPDCGDNWRPFGSSCYLLVETAKTWADANAHCRSLGAKLVDIHSPEENAFVLTYAHTKNVVGFWVGLTDTAEEDVFRWSSGMPLTFTTYAPYQPDGTFDADCIAADYWGNELWDDFPCDYAVDLVCEKPFM